MDYIIELFQAADEKTAAIYRITPLRKALMVDESECVIQCPEVSYNITADEIVQKIVDMNQAIVSNEEILVTIEKYVAQGNTGKMRKI